MGLRFVFLLLLSAAAANARSFTRDEFENQAARWRFECEPKHLKDITPLQRQALFARFKEAVWKGVAELQALNPQLAEKVRANVIEQSGSFVVSCAGAAVDSAWATFHSSARKGLRGKPYPELRLGKAFAECIARERLEEKPLRYKLVLENGNVRPYNVSLKRANQEICDSAFFHEFLHFAKADNVTLEAHGDFKTTDDPLKIRDAVYSCARTVFRYAGAMDKDYGPASPDYAGALSRASWITSCLTCVTAHGHGVEPPSARGQCNALFDEIPRLQSASPQAQPEAPTSTPPKEPSSSVAQ
jgi:hypothetical protein